MIHTPHPDLIIYHEFCRTSCPVFLYPVHSKNDNGSTPFPPNRYFLPSLNFSPSLLMALVGAIPPFATCKAFQIKTLVLWFLSRGTLAHGLMRKPKSHLDHFFLLQPRPYMLDRRHGVVNITQTSDRPVGQQHPRFLLPCLFPVCSKLFTAAT
jgi:hypothetical protein